MFLGSPSHDLFGRAWLLRLRCSGNTMDKNSDSFVAAVLGLLFVGRNGPRVRASIVGSLEKAAVVDVLLG